MKRFPFRIGTTSYIIPEDILPNVVFLADLVDDIELVLFEVDNGPNNLPDKKVIAELVKIARQHQLSYTVHLPLDLRLAGENNEQHVSLIKANKVIGCTRELNPHAYILHLDGRDILHQNDPVALTQWNRQALLALQQVSQWVPNSRVLAVENLEHYPAELWDEVIKQASVSRCVDIGHLWVDGLDPIAFLEDRIQETRVIHIHGIAERDHQSLANTPAEELERVIEFIVGSNYRGVMTMEIFNENDFFSSMEVIKKVWKKIVQEDRWDNS